MACAAGPDIKEDGLVLALDGGNLKSYSQNVFPYPLDGYSWGTSGHQMTVSRDTSTSSPVGNSPLKLVTSGAAAYTNTYNSLPFTLSPAAQGQTWTFSFWVKGSSSFSASMLIFESNSSGNYITYGQPYYSVTTEWTRVSGSYTMTQATTTGVQVRIDCYVNGVTLWVDGFQLEKASSASSLNSISNTNGTTWTDLSGNGNTGTLTNGPTYSSANGGSLVFDGVNDYVNCGSPSTLNFGTGNFNLSCWVNIPSTSGADWIGIISRYVSGVGFWIQLNPSNRYVGFGWAGGNYITSSTSAGGGQWKFISCQRTGSTSAEVYVNGILVASSSSMSSGTSNGQQIDIGRIDIAGRYSAGNIAQVSIYNRALSAQEIQQNYNALKGRFSI